MKRSTKRERDKQKEKEQETVMQAEKWRTQIDRCGSKCDRASVEG